MDPIFRVWDRQRGCWAGFDGESENVRDLSDYALDDEFKDAKLMACDMEGWALEDDGTPLLVDECGRFAYADPDRFEVRINPDYLVEKDLIATARWRARALAAEGDSFGVIRDGALALARLVIESRQNVGTTLKDAAQRLISQIEETERETHTPAQEPRS